MPFASRHSHRAGRQDPTREAKAMTPPKTASARPVNPIAAALNDALDTAAPEVGAMLSAFGRRLYFPKGILSQSAEAKEKAHRFNATIGIATEGDGPMYLESVHKHLVDMFRQIVCFHKLQIKIDIDLTG